VEKAGKEKNLKVISRPAESTEEDIDYDKLKEREKILFFDEVILYEDELDDNGCAKLFSKIVRAEKRANCALFFPRYARANGANIGEGRGNHLFPFRETQCVCNGITKEGDCLLLAREKRNPSREEREIASRRKTHFRSAGQPPSPITRVCVWCLLSRVLLALPLHPPSLPPGIGEPGPTDEDEMRRKGHRSYERTFSPERGTFFPLSPFKRPMASIWTCPSLSRP